MKNLLEFNDNSNEDGIVEVIVGAVLNNVVEFWLKFQLFCIWSCFCLNFKSKSFKAAYLSSDEYEFEFEFEFESSFVLVEFIRDFVPFRVV